MREVRIKQGVNGYIVELGSDSYSERPNLLTTDYNSTEVFMSLKDVVHRLSMFFEEEIKEEKNERN